MRGGEFGEKREAYAGGGAGEEGGEDDAGALVAGGEEDGVALTAEDVGAADDVGRGEEFAERAGRGDQALEAGVVAKDVKGEAAGGRGDAGARDGRVDRSDQRRGVDRGAEREGILEEEEVADVGEVGLTGVNEALEDAEVDEGSGFEGVGDNPSRIPALRGRRESASATSERPVCPYTCARMRR
jgi:hypothetical protein